MTKLEQVKKKVWDLVLKNLPGSSYIFGGAVRDHVAGDVYNDLDIWFSRPSCREQFIRAMVRAGCALVQKSLDWQEHSNAYGTPNLERYDLILDGETIQLDLVTKGVGSEHDPFNNTLDLDVNGLCIGRNGLVFKSDSVDDSLEALLQRCKDHTFMPVNELRDNRKSKMEKLQERGWRALYSPIRWGDENLEVGDEVWVSTYSKTSCKQVTRKSKVVEVTTRGRLRNGISHVTVVDSIGEKHHLYYTSVLGRAVEPSPYIKPATETTDTSEEGKMSAPVRKSFMEHFKSDITKGAFRTAAKAIPKTARTALLAFMKAKKAPKGWIKTAKEIMETEWGLAFIQQILAWGFRYFPMLKDDPRAQALADEWAIDAVATVGNEIVNELMGAMAPVIAQVMDLPMPPASQVRVETRSTEKVHSSEEDHEEEAEAEARQVA